MTREEFLKKIKEQRQRRIEIAKRLKERFEKRANEEK